MADENRCSRPILGAIAGAAAVAGYLFAIRPRILTWGATEEEAERSLPGDGLVPRPKMVATHAVTIRASAASICTGTPVTL